MKIILIALIRRETSGTTLPEELCDHKLSGELKVFRECHIELDDWLLVYIINKGTLMLTVTGTGGHTDLFEI